MKNIDRISYPDDHCQLYSCVDIDEAPRLSIRIDISLVAGAWTERKKMYHGGSFLKLPDDNKYIKNPEAQNRALRGF